MLINEISKIIGVTNIPSEFSTLLITNNNVALDYFSQDGTHFLKNRVTLGNRLLDEQVFQIEKLIYNTPGEIINEDKFSIVKKVETYMVSLLKCVGTPALTIYNADLSHLPWKKLVSLINEKRPFIIDENEFIYSDRTGIKTTKSPLNYNEMLFIHDYFHGISKDFLFDGETIVYDGSSSEYSNVGLVNLFNGCILVFTYDNGPIKIQYITFH
ncbi:hypothetical protein P9265_14930 [Schinkia azotoformans]|uniref:hypothetical protein n=1 Tax=Schinkia azotoformans TaxID=1454 RepID=UPI002E1DDB30|nr:hypothetical protein [Schinkia azotoformans]